MSIYCNFKNVNQALYAFRNGGKLITWYKIEPDGVEFVKINSEEEVKANWNFLMYEEE